MIAVLALSTSYALIRSGLRLYLFNGTAEDLIHRSVLAFGTVVISTGILLVFSTDSPMIAALSAITIYAGMTAGFTLFELRRNPQHAIKRAMLRFAAINILVAFVTAATALYLA